MTPDHVGEVGRDDGQQRGERYDEVSAVRRVDGRRLRQAGEPASAARCESRGRIAVVSETVITACGTITIRNAAAYTVGPVAVEAAAGGAARGQPDHDRVGDLVDHERRSPDAELERVGETGVQEVEAGPVGEARRLEVRHQDQQLGRDPDGRAEAEQQLLVAAEGPVASSPEQPRRPRGR